MADWNHPQLGDDYDDVLDIHIVGRDVDAITLQKSAPSNLPDGAMAYDRSTDLFKEWNLAGLAFVNRKLSVAGGGTGADNASQARTNLGLGTMAVQDSNSVSITGGSVSGITLNASVITAGVVALARGGTGASLALGTSGQVLQSDGAGVVFGTDGSQLSNLNASNLSSGTIPLARIPTGAGGIFPQEVGYTDTSSDFLNNVTSYTASTLAVTITPATSGHRVMVMGSFRLGSNFSSPSLSGSASVALYRSIGGGAFSQIAILGSAIALSSNNGAGNEVVPIFFVDSPATTSAVIYKLYHKCSSNGTSTLGFAGDTRSIVAIELV